MTFVNASLLAGAALIAVPIVLHLIMRRKPRQVEFPALRFVAQRQETNQRRLRLRHLLLLLLRAMAILLLALALARPSVKMAGSFGSQEAPVAVALVFDTAPHMEYRAANQTRLEAAGEMALWLLRQLPSGSRIAVLDARGGPAAFEVDLGSARERVRRLQTTAAARPLPGVIEEAVRLLGTSELPNRELYVFSDLSRGSWTRQSASRLGDAASDVPDLAAYVIDVGVAQPENFGLGEPRLSDEVLSRGGTLRVQTSLRRLGPAGERRVELLLLDPEGNEQPRDQEAVRVEADGSQSVEFRLGGLEEGTHQGVVRLARGDALAADDVRYFTVDVQRPWPILVAAPDPPERYALYLAEALAPTIYRKRGQARFDPRVVALDRLAEQSLDRYAAVLLLDPTPLGPATWKRLADYTAEGHGLGVFLGRNATDIESFNAEQPQSLLPAPLLRQARRPDGDTHLAPGSYQHPLLAPMRSMAGDIPWEAFPVFRYWQLGGVNPGGSVVIPLSDGAPFLLERAVGEGRVLAATSPVSDRPDNRAWNLLPVGDAWPFVILANQAASYLAGATEQQLNYTAGQTVTLRLDRADARARYLVRSPDDLTFPVAADLKRGVLTVTATDQAGNYTVEAGGRTGVRRGFSVNLAARQTVLRRVDEDALKQVFGPLEFRLARDRKQLEGKQRQARVGRELFAPLVILLVIVLAGEHLLANRFYRE